MLFSSVKVKYACDFTDLAAKSRVAITRRYHGDAMCTVPLWVPARRGGRLGFVIRHKDETGRRNPSITVGDHDFLLASRATLSLSGWVRMVENHRVSMSAFIRANKYFLKGPEHNVHDLLSTLSEDASPFDILTLISDNAADYTECFVRPVDQLFQVLPTDCR